MQQCAPRKEIKNERGSKYGIQRGGGHYIQNEPEGRRGRRLRACRIFPLAHRRGCYPNGMDCVLSTGTLAPIFQSIVH